jgi:delta24-sterol reductase
VLADGRLVTATADNEYADLFRALPWSYGTLGMLVAAEVRVIPAGKYVRLEYNPCRTVAEIEKRFAAASNAKDNDFVEALAYSPTHAVVMTGTMASEEDFKKERKSNPRVCVNNIARWYKPWFFTHVREKFSLRPDTVDVEYIPLREYYHRHTRPIFWQMRELVPFGNNLWFRLFLGWVLPIKVSLLKLTTPEAIGKVYEQKFVFQDMLVPLNTLTESLACFHKELSIYPLWLCPFILNKTEPQGFLKPTGDESEMFVDIGAYGMPPVAASDKFNVRQTIRNVEAFVTEKKGYQMLYADTYMTKEEFRVMFDHTNYDKLRTKYAAHDAFPDVFTKVRKQ